MRLITILSAEDNGSYAGSGNWLVIPTGSEAAEGADGGTDNLEKRHKFHICV